MISINYRDPRPIYVQIKDNLKRLIRSETLTAGSKLPSVRELATQLAINPNTIQRAYRELEAEGYILSIPGKGSFAAQLDAPDPQQQEAIGQLLAAVQELLALGLDRQALHTMIDDFQAKE